MPPKYVTDSWHPPVDTPPGNYSGPFPLERMLTDWGERGETGRGGGKGAGTLAPISGAAAAARPTPRPPSHAPSTNTTNNTHYHTPGGWAQERTTCPANYPKAAPRSHCGHYSFVEMDASMAYRSALAYASTGDERYARQAVGIIVAWAQSNKVFGLSDRNGPLEAAW